MVDNTMDIDYQRLSDSFQKRVEESELFSRRFGTFAKSDYEVLMFTVFIDSLKNPLRDYEISIALGITESKVRNLRIKSQLMYPRELEWIDELSVSIRHGYYDKLQQSITITIENPSVQSYVKNMIEEKFGTVGLSLNAKQLVLPIESLVMIAIATESNSEEILQELNVALEKEQKDISKIEKTDFKKRFLSKLPDKVSFLNNVSDLFIKASPIILALINQIQ